MLAAMARQRGAHRITARSPATRARRMSPGEHRNTAMTSMIRSTCRVRACSVCGDWRVHALAPRLTVFALFARQSLMPLDEQRRCNRHNHNCCDHQHHRRRRHHHHHHHNHHTSTTTTTTPTSCQPAHLSSMCARRGEAAAEAAVRERTRGDSVSEAQPSEMRHVKRNVSQRVTCDV